MSRHENSAYTKIVVIVCAGICTLCLGLLSLYPDVYQDGDNGVDHRVAKVFIMLSVAVGAVLCAVLRVMRDCTVTKQEWEPEPRPVVLLASAVEKQEV